MGMDEPREEIELFPPSPQRVAARAAVLSAVVARAFIDDSGDNPQAVRMYHHIRDWLTGLEIDEEIETAEAEQLLAPLGGLSEKRRTDASWLSEGLVVLGWALGRCELPPHDRQVDPTEISFQLGFLTDEARRIIASHKLRSSAEIDTLAEKLFALHWRMATFARTQARMDFAAFARGEGSDLGPLDLGDTPLVGGDLAIKGRPLFLADEADWRVVQNIAVERHRAANWLLGYAPLYSQVVPFEPA